MRPRPGADESRQPTTAKDCTRFTCSICGHGEVVHGPPLTIVRPTEAFFQRHRGCHRQAFAGKDWYYAERVDG